MLNLETKVRDEIVRFLQAQVVPANVGAGLMEVARILLTLKEVEIYPSLKMTQSMLFGNK